MTRRPRDESGKAVEAGEKMAEAADDLISVGGEVVTYGMGPTRCEVCGAHGTMKGSDPVPHKPNCAVATLLAALATYRAAVEEKGE